MTVRHTGYTDPALRERKLQRDCKILDAELAATHSGLLGRDGLDQLPNQRVFSASGISDKTVGLAMCYQLANRFARCY